VTRTPTAAPRAWSQTRLGLGQLARVGGTTVRTLVHIASPLAVRVGTVARPILGTVTTTGWLIAAVAVAAAAVGLLLGWAELLFLAITLAAAVLIAAGFAIGRSTYAVTIELNPRRVVAGDRALGRMVVANSGRRSLLPTRMELPVGAGVAEFTIPRLSPAEETEELFAVPTSKRALILAGPAVSVRGDQLGLVRRTQSWTDQIELFVHPKTARLRARAHGLVRDLEGQSTTVITNSDLAFHALRPYEPGDDMRHVHWRTSARTGQIMVRQYQETRRSQLLLLQSAESAHYASEDEFELAVSMMASVACQVITEDSAINVAWDRGPLRSRTPMALLDDSCRIERVRGVHPSLREFARRSGARLAVPSLVMIVVGSLADAGELRSISTLFGNDTEVIALRADVGAEARLSKVGAVTVATVTVLRELAPLLERAAQ
jgi:Protein of unknown function DUF58